MAMLVLLLGAPDAHACSPELTDDFASNPNGELLTADTGQPWNLSEAPADGHLRVINGKVTNVVDDPVRGAGYAESKLQGDVTQISATWTFSPYTSTTGAAGLIVWKTPIDFDGGPVPDSGMHLAIGPTHWAYGVIINNVLTVLQSGDFSPALPTFTEHRSDVTITGDTAVVSLPDGTTTQVTNPAIAANTGPWASFEVFQSMASTDSRASFTSFSANSLDCIEPPPPPPPLPAAASPPTLPPTLPPPTIRTNVACDEAQDRLASARARLQRLRRHDAKHWRIWQAKRKLYQAREAVRASC